MEGGSVRFRRRPREVPVDLKEKGGKVKEGRNTRASVKMDLCLSV